MREIRERKGENKAKGKKGERLKRGRCDRDKEREGKG